MYYMSPEGTKDFTEAFDIMTSKVVGEAVHLRMSHEAGVLLIEHNLDASGTFYHPADREEGQAEAIMAEWEVWLDENTEIFGLIAKDILDPELEGVSNGKSFAQIALMGTQHDEAVSVMILALIAADANGLIEV